MNLYKENSTRFEEDEPEKSLPENPMEKMMGGWFLTKNLLNKEKFFFGVLLMIKAQKTLPTGCYIWRLWIREKKLHSI